MADLDETVKGLRELAEGFDADAQLGQDVGDQFYRRESEASAKLLRDAADLLTSSVSPVGEEGKED